MRITDVRTVLLTGPSTKDPYFGRTRRSAAFVELLTDTELTGLGETYAGYFIPEAVPPIVEFYRPVLVGQTVEDVPALAARLVHAGRYWARPPQRDTLMGGRWRPDAEPPRGVRRAEHHDRRAATGRRPAAYRGHR